MNLIIHIERIYKSNKEYTNVIKNINVSPTNLPLKESILQYIAVLYKRFCGLAECSINNYLHFGSGSAHEHIHHPFDNSTLISKF